MAAARAEQSEQRERDECKFHLVPLAVPQHRICAEKSAQESYSGKVTDVGPVTVIFVAS